MSGIPDRLLTILRQFRDHQLASIAVEFALVAPVAITLYIGAAAAADGVMTSRKLDQLTRALVDLTSQQPTTFAAGSTPTPTNAMTASDLSNLMTSAQSLLTPEPTNTLAMTISAIDIKNTSAGICCSVTVRWSYTQGGTLRPCNVQLGPGPSDGTGSMTTVPLTITPYGTPLPQAISLLIADVSYTYQPLVQAGFMKFIPHMSRIEYMFPRTSGQVVTGPLPGSGAQFGSVCY